MLDLSTRAAAMRRPALLVRAARFGLDTYNREASLPRLLRSAAAPGPGPALAALLEIEQNLDDARTARSAGYTHARHVAVLTAIMAEARTLRAASAQVVPIR